MGVDADDLDALVVDGKGAEFERAFDEVRVRVAGTDGHISDELLHEEGSPTQYLLVSEWESKEAFLTWQAAPIHLEMTAPMQPYFAQQSDMRFYEVVASQLAS